jgi:SAM-dependent methyltransferase
MDATQVSDVWERGDPYEHYVGRWSRQVAPLFVAWLAVPAGRRWLDLGCGTGALCAAILDHCSPASVVGVDPSRGFLDSAQKNLEGRAVLLQGSTAAIPMYSASVDVAVSGLVLNFLPDPQAAVAESAKVTTPGGTIGGYVWDYAGKMGLMRFFWDAAVELDPGVARMDEGVRFPLCSPLALTDLFTAAGLNDVAVTPIDILTRFQDFDDYWSPFLGGQGPAPAYAMSLVDADRGRLRDRIKDRIPTAADGSISLTARAWAVRGAVSA